MWSYYGSKGKVINLYPPPKHDKIIEPFAGSARYSLKYFEKEILLVDLNPIIIQMWVFLQKCSQKDILGLPDFKTGDDIRNFSLSDDEKLFCGFLIGKGLSRPQNVVSSFAGHQPTWIPWQKKKIASHLHKIKHWEIILGSYTDIENETATYFIDPPYQYGGEYYKFGNKQIDYAALAQWCMSRDGQVIVCENTKASWMPFKPLKQMQGNRYRTTEAIWSNIPTNYDAIQQEMIFRE